MWKDLTPRVFQLFGQCLPLYHCATLTHDIEGKLLVSKNAFCYSNMANLYDSGTYTYKHIYQKEYFLNCILCGKT